MKLQIGMRVLIKNDTANYAYNAGKVRGITKELPDFQDKRAFELDNVENTEIWQIEDFEKCVDYPNEPME